MLPQCRPMSHNLAAFFDDTKATYPEQHRIAYSTLRDVF